jgi:ribosomal protein L12E/L44/L45/RPP1/RPP2
VRGGLDPRDHVTITIELDEAIPGRREARARVMVTSLTDEDIDRLIEEARKEAQPPLG